MAEWLGCAIFATLYFTRRLLDGVACLSIRDYGKKVDGECALMEEINSCGGKFQLETVVVSLFVVYQYLTFLLSRLVCPKMKARIFLFLIRRIERDRKEFE